MLKTTTILLVLGAATAAVAANFDARPTHPPPGEAIDACDRKADGDACSFEHRDRDIDGTCRALPEGDNLVCAPARPPGPPAEAIAACDDRDEGDDCSFEHRARQLDGVCRLSPRGDEPLACAPPRRRPR